MEKKKRKIRAIIAAMILIVLIILAGSTYHITVEDGTYKEDDWENAPYAASQYINGVKVEKDGTIKSNITIQELWDKMIEEGSPVNDYLHDPEDLARMIRAETVTKYPDTRKDPDEEINWDEVIKNFETLQGIIKFKRQSTEGDKVTLTYEDPEVFQKYIDTYNATGDETARQNAMKHFTLKQASSATSNGSIGGIKGGEVAAGEGVITDISQAIINAINNTPWPGVDLCLKWVDDVYTNAGVGADRKETAYLAAQSHIISTDKSAIPIGAAVYGTGRGSNGAGHVGIYIGDGKVVDSKSSSVETEELESWISWQTDNLGGQQGWLGWGWEDGNTVRGTTKDPNIKQSSDKDDKKDNDKKDDDKKDKDDKKEDEDKVQKAVETEVNGDGYHQEYTSSAGITYKHYKQYEGSYAGNPYWDGTISNSGCGPTSVAILASGLTNLNYDPGVVAAEMNASYGYTGAEPLRNEMDSLGMSSEIIFSPTAEVIQENLRNGKVMLVSVNSNTIFTSISHIMAIVDINESGQVYVCNPGAATLQGWYDVSEIMKGCDYIVTTDAGAAGVAKTTNTSNYVAVVATWKEVGTRVTTDDQDNNDANKATTRYIMTTTTVDYESMTQQYTIPFDLLWEFLVVGEDPQFIFEWTDLIYDSEIEITVYDNVTTNIDIDEWQYTKQTKAVVNARITAECDGIKTTEMLKDDVHEPVEEEKYKTTKTVTTQTNSINAVLTRANVWIVDYQSDYVETEEKEDTSENTIRKYDQEYPDKPDKVENDFSCEHIDEAEKKAKNRVLEKAYKAEEEKGIGIGTINPAPNVKIPKVEKNIVAQYYTRYIDMTDDVSNTTKTQKFLEGQPKTIPKVDKETEPNFVTIFRKNKFRKNKSRIIDAHEWLFELIEANDSTKDMLNLIKYLLYKATGHVYDGVDEFNFDEFFAPKKGILKGVGSDDYIVDTLQSPKEIVINDLDTLKKAFSGYSNDSVLQQYAYYFLECQKKYHVNAVFAAAVSITESSAGTNIAIGGNNMFSISNGGQGNWNSYGTMEGSIESFFKLINTEYFTNQQFTVDSISRGNPVGQHCYCVPPDEWIKNTTNYMTQMFNAAGINPISEANGTGEKIVEAAKSKLGCAYVWGAEGPDTFDCSGLTKWCYAQVGISISHNDASQKAEAKKIVSVSEARVGDILWMDGHVGIYIGNNQFIHAPTSGDVVKIANGATGFFTYALQFY